MATEARRARKKFLCPFLEGECTKLLRDGAISGACTVKLTNSGPIICCPNRLYDGNYQVLADVAQSAFGPKMKLIPGQRVAHVRHDGYYVAVFGKRWGKELRLPQRTGRGGYFVDWILARIGTASQLEEFVAVEIQAIDTTGNYRGEREAYLREELFDDYSKAGLNWENVSKRILPQIIYKGHVLRQESLCPKGLFFACPTPVYDRIRERLGGKLSEYKFQQHGALTFMWYDLGPSVEDGRRRRLVPGGSFTTTIDQVALAFTAPANLPPAGVYREAIEAELKSLRG